MTERDLYRIASTFQALQENVVEILTEQKNVDLRLANAYRCAAIIFREVIPAHQIASGMKNAGLDFSTVEQMLTSVYSECIRRIDLGVPPQDAFADASRTAIGVIFNMPTLQAA